MQGRLPPHESPRDSPLGPVAKRRRVMAAEQPGGHLSSSWMGQPLQQDSLIQSPYLGDDNALGYAEHVDELAAMPAAGASKIVSTGVSGPSLPLDQQQQQQQWNHQHAQHVSSYPEASLFQQPFFFQQTDPSIYNSPWPPTEAALAAYGNVAAPAGHYDTSHAAGPVLPSAAMPFFPEQSDVEATTALGGTAEFPPAYPDLYPTTYECTESQPRPDAQDSSSLYYEDASMHLKIQSLSILDDLARRLIFMIARSNYAQLHDVMHGKESEEGQAYATLKNLFDQTRKVYSRETPFIDAVAIQLFQPGQQEIIRQANTATFISSILGAHDVSFFHLNEYFLETFVPLGHRVLKWQGAIFLELKTQTYISALMNSDGNPEAILDELFPSDLDTQILSRHPDAPSLSPSEQDFLDRSRARKSYLLAEPSTQAAFHELPKKYHWNDFVREFVTCINKNVDHLTNIPARSQNAHSQTITGRSNSTLEQDPHHHQEANLNSQLGTTTDVHQTLHAQAGGPYPSAPTSTPPLGKPPAPASTVRQPWSKAEEDALVTGLARVNGPHWSQILALYGRGGAVNEILKDRNQVQLKDKARNLKLWYLKMGKDVPPALRGVTGELRKRGGARARAALGLLDDGEEQQHQQQ